MTLKLLFTIRGLRNISVKSVGKHIDEVQRKRGFRLLEAQAPERKNPRGYVAFLATKRGQFLCLVNKRIAASGCRCKRRGCSMMFINACKWILNIILQIVIGTAGSVLASLILSHFHLA